MTANEHANALLQQSAVWLAFIANTTTSSLNSKNAAALRTEIEQFLSAQKRAA